MMTSHEKDKESSFKKNIYAVGAAEMFWGLGFPLILESTFLQVFLKNLGASSFLVGLVPAMYLFCSSCFPVFASYLTRNLVRKKRMVLIVHLLPSFAIFGLGCVMFFTPEHLYIPLFFSAYLLFSISLGMAIPIWFNYLTSIFPDTKTVKGMGFMMLGQNVGKVIFSFFILHVVERYQLSGGSCAALFLTAGIFLIIGSLCYLFTVEILLPSNQIPQTTSFVRYSKEMFAEVVSNRPFLLYLIADLDFYVVLTIMSFYANYATGYHGVASGVAAGVFVGCIYAGSIVVNIFLGTMDLLSLKKKFVLSKAISLAALLLLIMMPWNGLFFLVSFMLGAVRAIRNMIYTPAVKRLSGQEDATPYYAYAPFLTLPVAFGLPLLFGFSLDHYEALGEGSYQLLFFVAFCLIGLTLLATWKTTFPAQYNRRHSEATGEK